jgi:integrase
MLTLFKREGSPFWYVRGTVHGSRVYASTKETDKADARRFKDGLEIRLARSAGEKCHAATFREAAGLYLEFRRPQKTDHARVERLCAVIGDRLLAEVRSAALVDAASVLYQGCTAATWNRCVFTPAAAILHHAATNDLCPYVRVKKMREKQPEPRAMRRDDARRLIAMAEGKLKLLLVFLFSQGWRISDALRLTWQDIDLSGGKVRHHVSRTDDWLVVPLHSAVLDMLRADAGDHVGRVFPWRVRGSLYHRLRPLCRKAGVVFTPHMARHSFATWLVDDGASTKDVMEAGGWKDVRAALRYMKIDERRVRTLINKIRV